MAFCSDVTLFTLAYEPKYWYRMCLFAPRGRHSRQHPSEVRMRPPRSPLHAGYMRRVLHVLGSLFLGLCGVTIVLNIAKPHYLKAENTVIVLKPAADAYIDQKNPD